ncbi:MAG: hypothetical protein ACLS6O_09585 [Bifidobacterium sp.]
MNNGEIIIDVRALQSQDIAIRRRVIVRSLAKQAFRAWQRVEGIDRLICDGTARRCESSQRIFSKAPETRHSRVPR